MSDSKSSTGPWWHLPEFECGNSLIGTARDLRDRDETRRIAYRVWDDLYEGRSLYAAENASALAEIGRVASASTRMINGARIATDFIHSKCTAEVPTVRAAGHGADGGQRRRARQLSQFIAGAHDDLDLDTQIPGSFLTALRTGMGCTKVVTEAGRIAVEVTSPREFYVDQDDGRHGNPRVLYQIKPIDRRALAEAYPDDADLILSLSVTADATLGFYDPFYASAASPDAVDLYFAWVLPTDSERGRYVVAVEGRVLTDEEWEDNRFPVAFLPLVDPRPGGGFWGMGLLERLDAAQCEIDDLVAHIGRSIRENNPKIFVDDNADVAMDQLADPTPGSIVRIAAGGRDPTFYTPSAVSPQDIEWFKELLNQLYAAAGLDQAAASGAQASKLTSGRAILFQHDMQTQRYVDMTKRIGRHVTDVIDRVLDAARRLSEDDPSWTVRYSKGSIVRQLDWSKVRMDADEYVIELEEVSPVPDTFAGRMQQLEQDAAEGRVSPEWFAQLRQDPDLWATRFQASRADADYVDSVIDQLLDPEREMPRLLDECPKQLMIDVLRTEILTGVVSGEDPAVIERLQRYASDVATDMQMNAPPGQQSGGVMMPNSQQLMGGGGVAGGGQPPQQ